MWLPWETMFSSTHCGQVWPWKMRRKDQFLALNLEALGTFSCCPRKLGKGQFLFTHADGNNALAAACTSWWETPDHFRDFRKTNCQVLFSRVIYEKINVYVLQVYIYTYISYTCIYTSIYTNVSLLKNIFLKSRRFSDHNNSYIFVRTEVMQVF